MIKSIYLLLVQPLVVTLLTHQQFARASFIHGKIQSIKNPNNSLQRLQSKNQHLEMTSDSTAPSTSSNTDATNNTKRQKTVASTTDTLEFLSTICGSLKTIKRTGWVRSGIPLPESDADHMHRCAMCAMLVTTQPPHPDDDYSATDTSTDSVSSFHPDNVDGNKLVRMAVTHDLCESLAGDVTPFCDKSKVENKHEAERQAMETIRGVVGGPLGEELFLLWKEYEELKTVEALYCKDIDKFEMIMQAYEYEKTHLRKKSEVEEDVDAKDESVFSKPLRTFFITTQKKMKSPMFKRLDAELRAKREVVLKERGWDVTAEER